MSMIPIGRNNINSDRIVNLVTPAAQGAQSNGVKLVLAGHEDLYLFGEEADAARAWLASQQPKPAVAPIATTPPTPPAK